jgi:1-aminocyclopropane-1-carboxylate deaminase
MFELPSPLLKIDCFEAPKVTLWMKREDLIHPQISGNKYRKLKYNLQLAKDLHIKNIFTKGGAFSNHIHATAAAGNFYNFNTFGFIRGEVVENKTLDFAKKNGMKLIFVSRGDYRNIHEGNFQDFLSEKISDHFFIPEGGTNQFAIKGVAEMITELQAQTEQMPDYICAACGTGGTLTGIIEGMKGEKKILGFSALKGSFMSEEIVKNQAQCGVFPYKNWKILNDYHFGGYAKMTSELMDFINFFEKKYDILLDPIYTGKMMFGIFDLLKKGFFKENSNVLVIHTGGLQGWNGFQNPA